jgi:hypothetical protein
MLEKRPNNQKGPNGSAQHLNSQILTECCWKGQQGL